MLTLAGIRFGIFIKNGCKLKLRGTPANDGRVTFWTFWRTFWSLNALWRLLLCDDFWGRLILFHFLVKSDCLVEKKFLSWLWFFWGFKLHLWNSSLWLIFWRGLLGVYIFFRYMGLHWWNVAWHWRLVLALLQFGLFLFWALGFLFVAKNALKFLLSLFLVNLNRGTWWILCRDLTVFLRVVNKSNQSLIQNRINVFDNKFFFDVAEAFQQLIFNFRTFALLHQRLNKI